MFRRTKRGFSLALFLLTLLSILNPASASAAYGEIDTTYGGNGTGYNFLDITDSSINFPIPKSRITSSAIDSLNRLVVAGYTIYDSGDGEAFALARFNSDGTLDSTFGPNSQGFVSVHISDLDRFNSVAVQSDNKIVAAGITQVSGMDTWVLARFNVDGSLDTSFGGNGTGFQTSSAGLQSGATSIAVLSSNEIIAAGTTFIDPGRGNEPELPTLAKYSQNGLLDGSFGSYGTGFETITVGAQTTRIKALTIDSSGRIIMVGGINDNSFMHLFIARFSSSGQIDNTFGGHGNGFDSSTVASSMTYFNAVVVQPDGKILAAGNKDSSQIGLIARYSTSGVLDPSFGSSQNGFVDFAIHGENEINALALDSDGSIITGGTTRLGGGNVYFVVSKHSQSGILENSFGNQNGHFLENLSSSDVINSIKITSSREIVFAGYSRSPNPNKESFVVGRLQAPPAPPVQAPSNNVPDPIQQSVILSIDSITPTSEGPAAIVIEGNFPEPIVNIVINNEPIVPARWEQSPTEVVITRVDPGPQVVQIYNGAVPLLPEQKIVIPAIAPVSLPALELPPLPLPEPESVSVGIPLDTAKAMPAAPLNIYFTMASSTLGDVSKKRIASWFAANGSALKSLQITGFAQPTPKGAALDPALSQRRANSVKNYLKELGFQGSITARGAGRTNANVATSRYVEVIGTATR